ncbi:uncharacterized protein LOC119395581 [Rhipicephalus sanguineus]|uniref:uncharacterized protein LOC119395581 n=1 Tax=Rhipicephalus sanguineus TaxID=34632 RepID=UPI001892EBBE|nr:uncharacterized protein LOC119395581 [Rhipicephalus sanguineus]
MASSSATLGKLPEFDPDNGDFEVYLERLECFIAANDIAEEKKLQVFLTTIGEKAYGTLRSLLLPKTPTKVTFEVAVDALKKHYARKSSVVTERYRFHQRKQEKHESVADFIVGLKKLAATCAFGTFLEEALRDRLIAGLQTDPVRCRLLATPDTELTWERTCNIAVAMEAATKDTQQMASTKSEGIAASVADLHWQGQAKGRRPQARAGKNAKNFHQSHRTPSWHRNKNKDHPTLTVPHRSPLEAAAEVDDPQTVGVIATHK